MFMNILFGCVIVEFAVQFIIRSFEALKSYVLNIISWTLGLIKFRRWLIPNVKHLYLVYDICPSIWKAILYVRKRILKWTLQCAARSETLSLHSFWKMVYFL